MGRLIAILLGGAALALYVPALLPVELEAVIEMWQKVLPDGWYARILGAGGGIFAGLALILLAVRGKE
jgi:hypothetical protein